MELLIKENARDEEVFSYCVLKDIVFKDKSVVVGDLPENKCPDIFCVDKSIGVEVVTCETKYTYKAIKFLRPNIKQVFRNKYKHYIGWKNKQITEYYYNFKQMLVTKFENLNKKMYDGCQKLCLCVVSNFAEKEYLSNVKLVEIINEVYEQFDRDYADVFVITKESVITFSKTNYTDGYMLG